MQTLNKMSPESRLIRAVCRKIIYGNSGSEVESLLEGEHVNWQNLEDLLVHHEIVPFFYSALKVLKRAEELIPQPVFRKFANSYYYTVADNLKKCREYKIICRAFKEQGIALLPIKGIAFLNDIYKSFPERPMVDIDILVKKQDIVDAENTLVGLGYRKELHGLTETYWLTEQCHLMFLKNTSKDKFFLELHWGVDFERRGKQVLPELWQRARGVSDYDTGTKLLSPEDAFFSLALHKRRFGKVLSIKNVIDAAILLQKHKDDFDWNYILREAEEGGLKSSIFFLLSQVNFLLGEEMPLMLKINVPSWKKRLINKLIESDTFSLQRLCLLRSTYLKSHFLLYNSIAEPVNYILNIPREQFAKFYRLDAYSRKTGFLYRSRFLYMPLRLLWNLFNRSGLEVSYQGRSKRRGFRLNKLLTK
jgi:hypothetical protein